MLRGLFVNTHTHMPIHSLTCRRREHAVMHSLLSLGVATTVHGTAVRAGVSQISITLKGLSGPVHVYEAADPDRLLLEHERASGESDVYGACLWPSSYVAARNVVEEVGRRCGSDVDQVCPALRHLQLELMRCLPVIGRRSHSTSWHARRSITKLSARLASELSVRMCSQTLRCHGNLAIRRRSWSVRTCCMKLRLHAQWADAWHAL